MSMPCERAVPVFHQEMQRTIRDGKMALLGAGSWAAPLAIIDAPHGFAEETWMACLPETVLAIRLAGATIRSYRPECEGASSAGGVNTWLLHEGRSNYFKASGRARVGHVYLSDAITRRAAAALSDEGCRGAALPEELIFARCGDLDDLTRAYVSAGERSASRLEMEARALLLLERLLTFRGDRAPARGGLAPWQLRRTCEAMQAGLDKEIGLDMLADIAGCSPTHFSRAFKQSTGKSPFAWLLDCKMDHAKRLLADAHVPLTDVALAVGFSAQPQFTTAFKRSTGVTPGAWRREQLA